MPKLTRKRKLKKILEENVMRELMLLYTFGSTNDMSVGENENVIIDDFLMQTMVVENMRYTVPLIRNKISRLPANFFSTILPHLNENNFKDFACLSWTNFLLILNEIENYYVHVARRYMARISLPLQLLVTLYRLGATGEDSAVSKVAQKFGIGVGTVQLVTYRVFKLILNLKSKYLSWPNAAERQKLTSVKNEGLPNCIGYIDCTNIKLAEKPFPNPKLYYTSNKIYAIKLQTVCDYKMRIIHMDVGGPGSIEDDDVFDNCELTKKSTEFFSEHEWLSGDMAYKLRPQLLTPYKESEIKGNEEKNNFNSLFIQFFTRIKICNCILKARFKSLKELKVKIKNEESSMQKVREWITVCGILYNIIQESGQEDCWDECELDFDNELEDLKTESNHYLNIEAETKRSDIVKLLKL